MSLSPTQSDAQAALAVFLAAVLPGNSGANSAVFAGTIAGATLTVTSLEQGTIALGDPVLGAAPETIITSFGTGSGGIGTYEVAPSQTIGTVKTFATGVTVIAGQPNRVAEPVNPWFSVMTPIRFERLATNVDVITDVKFTGSIASQVLDVTNVDFGTIGLGSYIFGGGVASGTKIIEFGTGSGGVGTYQVVPSQTLSVETLSAGFNLLTQNARLVVQVDFHGPDTIAGDLAQTVSTTIRDEYAVKFFAGLASPQNGIVPLYGDDPAERPFINDQNQYEWRWVLDVHLELQQSTQVSQEFADSVDLTLIDVPEIYPL